VNFKVKYGQSLKSFLVENLRRIYIPYLFFAFAWDVTNMVKELYLNKFFDFSFKEITKNILSVFIGGGLFKSNASIGASWFLMALFVVRIVCWIILKETNNNVAFFGAFSLCLFMLAYLCNGKNFLPFKIFSTLSAFLFLYIGYIAKNILKGFSKSLSQLKLVLMSGMCLMVVFFVAMAIDAPLFLVTNNLPQNSILTLIGGMLGCVGIYFLSVVIARTKVATFFSFFGVNSLIIMGIHTEIHYGFRLIFEIIGLNKICTEVLLFAIILLLSFPASFLLNKYFPVLVGKRNSNELKGELQ